MHETPLRYLSATDVQAALPDIEERLGLAERTMLGLGAGAQLPAKIGVGPAPAGCWRCRDVTEDCTQIKSEGQAR